MKKREVKALYNMALHDTKFMWGGLEIMRVIGGWVYYKNNGGIATGVFVPEPEQMIYMGSDTKQSVSPSVDRNTNRGKVVKSMKF